MGIGRQIRPKVLTRAYSPFVSRRLGSALPEDVIDFEAATAIRKGTSVEHGWPNGSGDDGDGCEDDYEEEQHQQQRQYRQRPKKEHQQQKQKERSNPEGITAGGHKTRKRRKSLDRRMVKMTLSREQYEYFESEAREKAATRIQAVFRGKRVRQAALPDIDMSMDISRASPSMRELYDDLAQLFSLMDRDDNGALSAKEVLASVQRNTGVRKMIKRLRKEVREVGALLKPQGWYREFKKIAEAKAEWRKRGIKRRAQPPVEKDQHMSEVSKSDFCIFFVQLADLAIQEKAERERRADPHFRTKVILREVFLALDANKNGTLDRSDVLEALCTNASMIERVPILCDELPSLKGLLRPAQWRDVFKSIIVGRRDYLKNKDAITWPEMLEFYTTKYDERMAEQRRLEEELALQAAKKNKYA